MAHHDTDERVIHTESDHYNATLVCRVDQTSDLAYFWVRFDDAPTAFGPGQYMTVGVYAHRKLVQRPYSVPSALRAAGTEG